VDDGSVRKKSWLNSTVFCFMWWGCYLVHSLTNCIKNRTSILRYSF
jgi:hypothetical protein